ncbi:hypothetical protein D3C75_1117660 [compost metagenome]
MLPIPFSVRTTLAVQAIRLPSSNSSFSSVCSSSRKGSGSVKPMPLKLIFLISMGIS